MNYARLGALALAVLATSPALASEADFVLVTAMPPVLGQERSSIQADDPRTGLSFTKTVYAADAADLSMVTHVAKARCGAGGADMPYIMAVQYLPKDPQTFIAATQTDVFAEVYVREPEGAVRLYENLNGFDMTALTNRFMPRCQGI